MSGREYVPEQPSRPGPSVKSPRTLRKQEDNIEKLVSDMPKNEEEADETDSGEVPLSLNQTHKEDDLIQDVDKESGDISQGRHHNALDKSAAEQYFLSSSCDGGGCPLSSPFAPPLPLPDAPKVKHRKFRNAVGKVITANRAKKEALVSSLGLGPSYNRRVSFCSTSAEDDKDGGGEKESTEHPNIGSVSTESGDLASGAHHASSAEHEQTESIDTVAPTMYQAYQNAFENAQELAHQSSAKLKKAQRKATTRETKKQAEIFKLAKDQSDEISHRRRRAVEKLTREKSIQDDISQSEIILRNTTDYFTKSASLVVDNLTKLSKHDSAVMRLREEADKIKQRKQADNDEERLRLEQEEENRVHFSVKQKEAYHSEWLGLQTEMALLREQMTTESSIEVQAQLDASPYFDSLQAQGVQDEIELEVRRAVIREAQRKERTMERLQLLEQEEPIHVSL